MIRKLFLTLTLFMFSLFATTNIVFANGTARIISSPISASVNEEFFVALKIDNNPGIMGFKLHFEYPYKDIQITSVSKGSVIQKGNLSDNIGNKNGSFDILWNSTTEVSEDGTLAVLKCKLLCEKDFEIKVSYSELDTFNEKWESVKLDCFNIKTEGFQSEDITKGLDNSYTDKQENKFTTNKITLEKTDKSKESFDVEFIIIDVLKEYEIEEFEYISKKTQTEVVDIVNKKIYSVVGTKEYFKNFNDVKNKLKNELKKELKTDVDSLDCNESSQTIIKKFLDENKNRITKDNVTSLIEVFEEKGLNNKYVDYLNESELAEVLNDVYNSNNTIQATNNKVNNKHTNLNFRILFLVSTLAIVLIGFIVVIFVKRKDRQSYEK